MRIEELIKECLVNNIIIMGVELSPCNTLGYRVAGFSKSGDALVYYDTTARIRVDTRYDNFDYISSFEDLARVAYRWNKNYLPYGYSWDSNWAPIFVKYGWLKESIKTTISYEIVKL